MDGETDLLRLHVAQHRSQVVCLGCAVVGGDSRFHDAAELFAASQDGFLIACPRPRVDVLADAGGEGKQPQGSRVALVCLVSLQQVVILLRSGYHVAAAYDEVDNAGDVAVLLSERKHLVAYLAPCFRHVHAD